MFHKSSSLEVLSHFIKARKRGIPMSLSSFPDSNKECKSSEGFGELICELEETDKD